MNCRFADSKIHEYLDFRLTAREASKMEAHLLRCPSCKRTYGELLSIQQMLSARIRVPEQSSAHCLKRIRRKRFWSEPIATLCQFGTDFRSFLRDINRTAVMARMAALPLTCGFFAVLIAQFPVLSLDTAKFPVLSMQGWTASAEVRPLATKTFATRQGETRFKDFMDAAWRLPYEDSLSMVAEITPEGHARNVNVLEYPKSNRLFNAADLALRSSQFVASDSNSNPYVLFSFQKIDVWDQSLER